MPVLTAADYGESAPDLEAFRRMLDICCPAVQFAGHSDKCARRGEYRFMLPPTGKSRNRSIYVQAPKTPTGKSRNGLGMWRYRMSGESTWKYSALMDFIVGWICRQAEMHRT